MESVGLNQVGDALLITVGMLVVAITIVGLAMWGVYKFFKDKSGTSGEKE